MARPRKWRRVCCLPDSSRFGPLDFCAGGDRVNQIIDMTVDEYESIRLIDLEGYTQEECAGRMSIARTTVQGDI
jgi:Predicted DNA-binding proteins